MAWIVNKTILQCRVESTLTAEDICKDDKLVVQENLMGKLNDTKLDLNALLYLTGQNIDIFNLSSDFYTDLCYNYESNIDKDVALKDRILIYFPNITLCENGCETIGVNVTTLEAICECTFNIKENNILRNNIIYQSQLGQIEEEDSFLVTNSNHEFELKKQKGVLAYDVTSKHITKGEALKKVLNYLHMDKLFRLFDNMLYLLYHQCSY